MDIEELLGLPKKAFDAGKRELGDTATAYRRLVNILRYKQPFPQPPATEVPAGPNEYRQGLQALWKEAAHQLNPIPPSVKTDPKSKIPNLVIRPAPMPKVEPVELSRSKPIPLPDTSEIESRSILDEVARFLQARARK